MCFTNVTITTTHYCRTAVKILLVQPLAGAFEEHFRDVFEEDEDKLEQETKRKNC